MAWYDIGSNLYDLLNPPRPPAPSPMLKPDTEAKAAQYLIERGGEDNPLFGGVTPYTQQLVRRGGTAYKPPHPKYGLPGEDSTSIPTPGGSTSPGMTEDQYRYWQTQNYRPQPQQPDYTWQIAQLEAQIAREQIAAENARKQQEIEWYRQKQQAELEAAKQQYLAELEAEKQQRLATLAAQPKSWLEYAALSGQAPVVQPWMLPLMRGDYGITSAGSPIPNWSATDMTHMPDLIPPSAQYMARIGPTARDQLYGYEQAVHGATPDESQWRQWSMSPPGGNSYRGLYRGLEYQR